MHEVSLANALIELVREQAVAAKASRVTRLVLEIGALSHVDAHALRFAVDVAARGGPGRGRRDRNSGAARAPPIASTAKPRWRSQRAARRVPCCGGVKLLVQGGDEMRLKEMEVV